jgi:hypothetical protein
MIGQPAPERVVERMRFAWSEQLVIPWLAVQVAAAGMPVGACLREASCVDERRVGIGAEHHGSAMRWSQDANVTVWRGLTRPSSRQAGHGRRQRSE